jgi:hypothetical protein
MLADTHCKLAFKSLITRRIGLDIRRTAPDIADILASIILPLRKGSNAFPHSGSGNPCFHFPTAE